MFQSHDISSELIQVVQRIHSLNFQQIFHTLNSDDFLTVHLSINVIIAMFTTDNYRVSDLGYCPALDLQRDINEWLSVRVTLVQSRCH